jgi:transposase
VLVTAGQAHESAHVERLLERVRVRRPGRGRPRCRPAAVAGDKGYSHPRIRRYLAGRGIRAVIPRRSDQRPGDGRVRFDRELYRRRNVVERCVGWLEENRRLATRHEKLAINFQAMATLAVILLCLRRLDSPDRA